MDRIYFGKSVYNQSTVNQLQMVERCRVVYDFKTSERRQVGLLAALGADSCADPVAYRCDHCIIGEVNDLWSAFWV
jgi:hypothetical protein